MQVLPRRVDRMPGSGPPRRRKLAVVHVDGNRLRAANAEAAMAPSPTPPQPQPQPQPQPKTAIAYSEFTRPRAAAWNPTVSGSTRQRSLIDKFRRIQFCPRYADVLSYSAVPLHAHRLVPLASVYPSAQAGRTYPAVCVGRHRHWRTCWQITVTLYHYGRNLMAQHARKGHHRIASAIGIQVGAAHTHHLYLKQRLLRKQRNLRHLDYARNLRGFHAKRLNVISLTIIKTASDSQLSGSL